MKRLIKKYKNLNDNKKVLAVFGILSAVLITVSASYAFFSYSKLGLGENTLETGSIKFIYNESNRVGNGISLTDAMPMPDEAGKAQDKYFDFSVTGTSGTSKLNYEITARKVTGSDNLDEYVKMYLTKVNGNNETQKVLSIYDDLSDSTNAIAVLNNEKTLYRDSIPVGATDYTENYRLRMWLNDDTNDGSVLEYTQTETGVCSDTQYTTESDCVQNHKDWTRTATAMTSKVFTVKVNVYANGEMATQQEIADADSTGIRSVEVNNSSSDSVVNQNYDFYQEVPYGTTNASIEIETANPDATVDIEKINPTAQSNNIRRLSTVVKAFDLVEGDNYYKITVTSKNRTKTEEYKLKVTMLKSNDATLSSLSISDCPLNTTFNPNTTSYTCTTEEASVTPTYTKGHNGANVVVTGGSGLSLGSNNTLTLTVTAEDGVATKTYKITITRNEKTYLLTEAIFNKYPASSAKTNPTLTQTADLTNETGLYKSTDTTNNQLTYYFRGAEKNNYVNFAGKVWRIVRINEDGSIRIITDTEAIKHLYAAKEKSQYFSATGADEAKGILNSWYATNINKTVTNSTKKYSDYVYTNGKFCEELKADYSNNRAATFKCNRIVTTYIATLSLDEVIFAGIHTYDTYNVIKNTSNATYYLSNSPGNYWTTTPYDSVTNSYNMWVIRGGRMSHGVAWDTACYLRPVINLKSTVRVKGTGTSTTPWTVVYN